MLTKDQREELRAVAKVGDRWSNAAFLEALDTCDALERERDEARAEIARLREAVGKVPIVCRSNTAPFSTCLGCGRTDSEPCAVGCWVQRLEDALAGTTGQRTGSEE